MGYNVAITHLVTGMHIQVCLKLVFFHRFVLFPEVDWPTREVTPIQQAIALNEKNIYTKNGPL